jgi:hypothetical protein
VKFVDIFELMKRSYDVLKQNLLLFLPPLVLLYLAPVALGIAALYIFIPMLVIAGNSPTPIFSLIGGGIVGGIIILILAVILFVVIAAGMSNLTKTALLSGEPVFDDFTAGVKKYFARILGGVILLAIIYLVLFFIGVGAAVAMIFSAIKGLFGPEMLEKWGPKMFEGGFPEMFEEGFPTMPDGLMLIKTMFKMFANFSGVALLLVTIAGIICIFTLFWIPAAVVDDVGVFRAFKRSVRFVRENFYTTLGFIGLYIIAELFTNRIFPGGGGGGGGGGPQGGYGFGFAIGPSLEAIFQLLIITFFTLLLFAIYADRTGQLKQRVRRARARK